MFRLVTFLFITCCLLVSISYSQSQKSPIPTLTYKELIAKQNEYAGKQVRVSGYWNIFFEVSALHSLDDPRRKNAAWVDFGDTCKGSDNKLKKVVKDFIGDVSVVFVGKLETGGRFGHENGYKYRFVVDCVEQIKKLPNVKNLCNQLAKIRTLPTFEPTPTDPVYEELIARGDNAVPCLIEHIGDRKIVPDPRYSVPTWDSFAVGDTAFFVLLDILSKGDDRESERLLLESLPPKSREEWKTNGIYAYFNYVLESKNRKALQQWWKNWLNKNKK